MTEPTAKCYDCGLPYGDPGFADLVVPNEAWLAMSPTGHEGGLLCPTCMVRAATVAGLDVMAVFRSGPFANAAESAEARLERAEAFLLELNKQSSDCLDCGTARPDHYPDCYVATLEEKHDDA